MKYFKEVVLTSADRMLIELIHPSIITETTSGIILDDGSVKREAAKKIEFKIAQTHPEYNGNMQIGDFIFVDLTKGVVPQQYLGNKEYTDDFLAIGKGDSSKLKYIIVRSSSIDAAYREEA